jgi:hypothetical protein|tara:strand:- start:4594 stop:4824 length:231 start_codon:yes stop_codon:yes gene_type:complete
MEAAKNDKIKSYRDTMLALAIVFCHYDIEFLKLLDPDQLEDLFIQDAFSNPVKHKTYELDRENINFNVIKEQLTSS